jgi:hypothetical protein
MAEWRFDISTTRSQLDPYLCLRSSRLLCARLWPLDVERQAKFAGAVKKRLELPESDADPSPSADQRRVSPASYDDDDKRWPAAQLPRVSACRPWRAIAHELAGWWLPSHLRGIKRYMAVYASHRIVVGTTSGHKLKRYTRSHLSDCSAIPEPAS